MNAKELTAYYKHARVGGLFFPNKLKAALKIASRPPVDIDHRPVEESKRHFYALADRHMICKYFEEGLKETGPSNWAFKKLYKRQIGEFTQSDDYRTYLCNTGKAVPAINSNHSSTGKEGRSNLDRDGLAAESLEQPDDERYQPVI